MSKAMAASGSFSQIRPSVALRRWPIIVRDPGSDRPKPGRKGRSSSRSWEDSRPAHRRPGSGRAARPPLAVQHVRRGLHNQAHHGFAGVGQKLHRIPDVVDRHCHRLRPADLLHVHSVREREGFDRRGDGYQAFELGGYDRACGQVWKPATWSERRRWTAPLRLDGPDRRARTLTESAPPGTWAHTAAAVLRIAGTQQAKAPQIRRWTSLYLGFGRAAWNSAGKCVTWLHNIAAAG